MKAAVKRRLNNFNSKHEKSHNKEMKDERSVATKDHREIMPVTNNGFHFFTCRH